MYQIDQPARFDTESTESTESTEAMSSSLLCVLLRGTVQSALSTSSASRKAEWLRWVLIFPVPFLSARTCCCISTMDYGCADHKQRWVRGITSSDQVQMPAAPTNGKAFLSRRAILFYSRLTGNLLIPETIAYRGQLLTLTCLG
ncbi:hypothetical protein PG989_014632 [Apiospora arundinis]